MIPRRIAPIQGQAAWDFQGSIQSLDWTGGLDRWTGPVDWTGGLTFKLILGVLRNLLIIHVGIRAFPSYLQQVLVQRLKIITMPYMDN